MEKLGVRSKLEGKVKDVLDRNGVAYEYESERWEFEKPASRHKYTPDFKIGDTYYEVKGRFVVADRAKMLLVRDQHPEKRIVMLFDRPDNKLYTGSKTTYAAWCDRNGIAWQSVDAFLKDNYGYERPKAARKPRAKAAPKRKRVGSKAGKSP